MAELFERVGAALASRYRLQRELGQGGMAKVFLAHDLKYERAVAVKVLKPELAAEVGAARFLFEIQIAARLHHPHILPLYDSDQIDGLVYYVMPYIEGETLRQRLLRERQLPVADALQIAREVADALNYAHNAKVVHRDIKPANILLDSGHALVADFGIARAMGSGESTTGHIIGTPAYMSPEQVEGLAQIDGRSDIYSLGAVLFEMLVGEPPFKGTTPLSVIASRYSNPIPSPRTFRDLIPEALDATVRKAMATLPADRYSTAAQFAEALSTPVTVAVAVGSAQSLVGEKSVDNSIAVLPFENMSTDPENEYFSDGVTDDIIAQLSKISALKVISRTSTMQYKKTTKKIGAIADELGVASILEGSVRRAGSRVRIVAHLVDPKTEKHLWGETFDRQLTDVFEVQSEVAQSISGALSAAISTEEKQRVEKKPTSDVEAYNLYLLGRFHANKWSEESVNKAIDFYRQAIAKDPGYALAYAGLADAYEILSIGLGSKPAIENLAQAKTMALKALEMDDSLAEAHTSLAYTRWLGDLDWSAAEREFKRALDLKASYVTAHQWYAEYLAALGRHDEALAEIKKAQQLDPLSVPVTRAVGWVLYFARKYDQAIEELQKALAMDAEFLAARMVLWWVQIAKGNYADAIADIKKESTRAGSGTVKKLMLAYANAAAGNQEEASGILWEIEPKLIGVDRLALLSTFLFAAMNEKERAFACLERAYQSRDPGLMFLRVAPWLDPLRSDPRFAMMLERLSLAA
ncbi:MAG TPA: protein kinase [Gemmatimonadaceae bacterium]|jgi:serine/threonine protein kinase/Tfp pilus assembly protein PilF|nr:protein kinase [Gemmatimonadaceae bacterium]